MAAFKQGLLEVMKTTVHAGDHEQLSPVARPGARLRGVGITNSMAGVRCDPEITTTERAALEKAILRLRGLRREEVNAVVEGRHTILLQRFRLVPSTPQLRSPLWHTMPRTLLQRFSSCGVTGTGGRQQPLPAAALTSWRLCVTAKPSIHLSLHAL